MKSKNWISAIKRMKNTQLNTEIWIKTLIYDKEIGLKNAIIQPKNNAFK